MQAWVDLCENLSIETSEQFLSSPIWYNPRISPTTLYLPKWFRHGIESMGNVVDNNGILITENEMKVNLTFLVLICGNDKTKIAY